MYIRISPDLFKKQNDLLIGVVVAEGIDNKTENKGITDLLASVVAREKQLVMGKQVKDFREFEPYHTAMRNFGISLSRFQMSVEAMLKRLSKGDDMPSISPIVDLGNAVSLQHHVPIGAHDIGSLVDDLEIRCVKDDDVFEGADDSSGFDREEVVYASGKSIRTRRWIWRQMPAGRTGPDSKNLVFPIDGFASNKETILAARDALSTYIKNYLGCEVKIGLIDKDSPSFKISG